MAEYKEDILVPKEFDNWYQAIKKEWTDDNTSKRFALWKLSQKGFGYGFEDVNHRSIGFSSEFSQWLIKNQDLAIDAIFYGYKVDERYLMPVPYSIGKYYYIDEYKKIRVGSEFDADTFTKNQVDELFPKIKYFAESVV